MNAVAAHHEIFRAAARWYPQASPERRRALIEAVSRYQAPESDHFDSDELSAHHCFTWFHWLHDADPDCGIAKEALDAVWAHHPQFVPSEHPDFTHFWRVGEVTSPLTADSLLAKPADEVLPDLLAYATNRSKRASTGIDRWALLRAVEEAVRTNPSWGLDLADAMVANAAWDTDIWYHIILFWATSELDHDTVTRVMSHLSAGEASPTSRTTDSRCSQPSGSKRRPSTGSWIAGCGQLDSRCLAPLRSRGRTPANVIVSRRGSAVRRLA